MSIVTVMIPALVKHAMNVKSFRKTYQTPMSFAALGTGLRPRCTIFIKSPRISCTLFAAANRKQTGNTGANMTKYPYWMHISAYSRYRSRTCGSVLCSNEASSSVRNPTRPGVCMEEPARFMYLNTKHAVILIAHTEIKRTRK